MIDMPKTNADVTPTQCADAMLNQDACSKMMGMELVSTDRGRAVVKMQIRKDMVNGHNTTHGGMIFTLADTAFAVACNSYNLPNVAEFCTINFMNPAFLGDVLTASAKQIHQQGRNGLYDIALVNQDGLKIAEFRGKCRQIKGQHVPTLDQI
ncbi:MAG: hydroxyphenylacetyl-CoA thioesterase PaaI [Rhizobiales bacterium]|nr:hydroxyphenylacetyl-CoA thioesterase PaaI [Hyphomicrobiales bacterium]